MGILSRFFRSQQQSSEEPDLLDEMLRADADEMQKVVNDYGRVMMDRESLSQKEEDWNVRVAMVSVAPASMLPYSKEQIKEAIKFVLTFCTVDEAMIGSLVAGYTALAHYISDEEASSVFAGAASRRDADMNSRISMNYSLKVCERNAIGGELLLRELYDYLTSIAGNEVVNYAVEEIRALLRVVNDKAEYCRVLAQFHIEREEWEQAAEKLEDVIQIEADDIQSHINLGFVYLKLGKSEPATLKFEQVLKIDPNYGVASYFFLLGNAYEEVSRLEDSIKVGVTQLM